MEVRYFLCCRTHSGNHHRNRYRAQDHPGYDHPSGNRVRAGSGEPSRRIQRFRDWSGGWRWHVFAHLRNLLPDSRQSRDGRRRHQIHRRRRSFARLATSDPDHLFECFYGIGSRTGRASRKKIQCSESNSFRTFSGRGNAGGVFFRGTYHSYVYYADNRRLLNFTGKNGEMISGYSPNPICGTTRIQRYHQRLSGRTRCPIISWRNLMAKTGRT